ncbi:MAG: response regulator transcription factor [Eubacterium sp.]|nr:response regulator transcription factor [Eubacterium sp.]
MDYSVLIVDDEVELAESTAEYFNMFDVSAKCVFAAIDAIEFFKSNTAKLILLDINLEGKDGISGFELCKKFRETMDVPILFISARSSDDDMVIALNIGGDDYITKPYSLSVLFAKVKAVLKRYERSVPAEEHVVYEFSNVKIDMDASTVYKDGELVNLTAMEYRLLHYLVKNKNRVIPKNEIFDNVWDDCFVSDGTLNVHIRHLREKLEEDSNNPKFIKTVRGLGIMFKE